MTSTVTPQSSLYRLADRFFDAIAAADLATVRGCFAAEATVWHNFDNVTQSADENLQLLAWVSANWRHFRFEDVQRWTVDDGFMQRHTMRGEGPDGTPFETSSFLIVKVDDGKIVRIDEWFDPRQTPMPTS